MVCGLDTSLSITLIVAVSDPVTEAVNVTAMEQVVPIATVPQLEVASSKSAASAPMNEILPTVTGLLVRFASVTTKGWLVTPTTCLPKLSVDGLRIRPVARPGDNLATNAAPVLNVV
jgi:hypothetical protein